MFRLAKKVFKNSDSTKQGMLNLKVNTVMVWFVGGVRGMSGR